MEGDFHVAGWLVQPLRDLLVSPDQRVGLEPKAMDLLVYLAENQGEVIPKERLIRAVWPDAFVTDEVLTNTVWKLRQAFGDDPRNPRIIQTVPRRGYQLIAEATFEEAGDEHSNRFELQRLLGKGAMGEVHLARDLLLSRQVALKFLPAQMEEDDSLRRRLFREARAAAALDQPYICKVYDTGQMEGRTFIAMEYVKGQTLKERLKEGPLSVERGLRVLTEVSEALHAAHEEGIVHRDIKPSNIMLTAQGHVKVMDFGVAKKLPTPEGDQDWTATLTADASSMGTLPYMSPEQIRGQEVDIRSDIFSLGVVAYEILTGVHPFRRPLSADTAAATLNEAPPALSRFRKKLPQALQELVARMLAKEREDRYQSIWEVREDLLRLVSRKTSLLPAWTLKRKLAKLAAATLVLLVIATVAVLVTWNTTKVPSISRATRPTPLSNQPGVERLPALSPDGAWVAFSWRGKKQEGAFDIYVQLIGAAEPSQLTTDPAPDLYPTWSPDRSKIAFLRQGEGTRHSVHIVSLVGGPEEKLADSNIREGGFGSGGLSWSPDERVIAMVDRSPPVEDNSIFLLSLDTREKRRLTSPPIGAWDDWPKFSPDGSAVAFLRVGPDDQIRIYLQDVQGRESRKLFNTPLFVRGMDWTSDGSALVVCLSEIYAQDSFLLRVPVDGSEPARLSFGEGAMGVTIARSGGRMAFETVQVIHDIWRTSGPEAREVVPPTRLATSSTRVETFPEYSPDGSTIAFNSDRAGDLELWRCDADGTNLQKLTSLGFAGWADWSPSGDRIAFCALAERDENSDIFVIDATGGVPRKVTGDDSGDCCPSWSVDGRWIYYHSTHGDGLEIQKVPAEGGNHIQLTKNGGRVPRVADDGQVFFWRDERIWKLTESEKTETLLFDEEVELFGWCTWKRYIVFIGEEAGEPCIKLFNLESGVTTCLQTLGQTTRVGNGLTVSPDGQWILYTQAEFNSDLMLVEDFH